MAKELATPFNKRLVSSTPDPDKLTGSPLLPVASNSHNANDSDSDNSTLIGDDDYLKDDLKEPAVLQRTSLQQTQKKKSTVHGLRWMHPQAGKISDSRKGHPTIAPKETDSNRQHRKHGPGQNALEQEILVRNGAMRREEPALCFQGPPSPEVLESRPGRAVPIRLMSGPGRGRDEKIPQEASGQNSRLAPQPHVTWKTVMAQRPAPPLPSSFSPSAAPAGHDARFTPDLRAQDPRSLSGPKVQEHVLSTAAPGSGQSAGFQSSPPSGGSGALEGWKEAQEHTVPKLGSRAAGHGDEAGPKPRAILGRCARPESSVEAGKPPPLFLPSQTRAEGRGMRRDFELPLSPVDALDPSFPSWQPSTPPWFSDRNRMFPANSVPPAPAEGSPENRTSHRRSFEETPPGQVLPVPTCSETESRLKSESLHCSENGTLKHGKVGGSCDQVLNGQAVFDEEKKPKELSPGHVVRGEVDENEVDEEICHINGRSGVTSISSPLLCANGSAHRHRSTPCSSPTDSNSPSATSPTCLSPMPFTQAAGEFNCNARSRVRFSTEPQSPPGQMGDFPRQGQQQKITRNIRFLVKTLREHFSGEGEAYSEAELEQLSSELEDAVASCPNLKQGFNLQTEIDLALQPVRTELMQLRRRVKTLNSQLSEREKQIRDLSRPRSEADRAELDLERVVLQSQLKEAVQNALRMEREADLFRRDNMRLREENSRLASSSHLDAEVHRLSSDLQRLRQEEQRLSEENSRRRSEEKRQMDRMREMMKQESRLREENARLVTERMKLHKELQEVILTMSAKHMAMREDHRRELERVRNESNDSKVQLEAVKSQLWSLQTDKKALSLKLLQRNQELDKLEKIVMVMKEGIASVLGSLEPTNGCQPASKNSGDAASLQRLLASLHSIQQAAPSPSKSVQSDPSAPRTPQGEGGRGQPSSESAPGTQPTAPSPPRQPGPTLTKQAVAAHTQRLQGSESDTRGRPADGGCLETEKTSLSSTSQTQAKVPLTASQGFDFAPQPGDTTGSWVSSQGQPKPPVDKNAKNAEGNPSTSGGYGEKITSQIDDVSRFSISGSFLKCPRYPAVEKERAGDLELFSKDRQEPEYENNNLPAFNPEDENPVLGSGNRRCSSPIKPFEKNELNVSMSTIAVETESVISAVSNSTNATSIERATYREQLHRLDEKVCQMVERLKIAKF